MRTEHFRKRRRRALVGDYLVLLLVSTIFRRLHSRSGVPEGMRVASLRTIDQGRAAPGQIRLAFIDTSQDARSMPVVLVHGSPGTSSVFGSVTPALAPGFRVIVPDLPGFGASTHELPDYSFRAHAQYILELLDERQIRKAQLVGFSMGGGVVLSMADIAPERCGFDCFAVGDRRSGAGTTRELHGKPRSSRSTTRSIVAASRRCAALWLSGSVRVGCGICEEFL